MNIFPNFSGVAMVNCMKLQMMLKISFLVQIFLFFCAIGRGQEISVINYGTNANGQVQLEVSSSPAYYYILKVRHNVSAPFERSTSLTLGNPGTTVITEALSAYPIAHYQVLEYPIATPFDSDGDGVDDITEYNNRPIQSPLNAAAPLNDSDGFLNVDRFQTFNELSVTHNVVQWSEFLNGKKFVKYIIGDFYTSQPKIYFINTEAHELHSDFANAVGIDGIGDQVKKGQIIYHPTSISSNGTLGTFAFNYSNGHGDDFEVVQRTHELLAANMPMLQNNLSYYITENNEDEYEADELLYMTSRIPVLFEADIFAEIDYWGLNQTEGFGLLRHMDLKEIPGPRDIVLYESLPNALPRVGGIISSVIQTPLSHVNLRAIQDGIPNAFIRDPLSIDAIVNLLDHYVYYKVEQNQYTIREASLEEVNAWYESIRPAEEQLPPLNLSHTSILPLDQITFSMYDGYGAKCANVATMRTFGFPEGTIPNGFGVPFYFYQEFMEYNGLFAVVESMVNDSEFLSDRDVRNNMLGIFREQIRQAELPGWMIDELTMMQTSFPEGISIRCRSSTNNEDLPGFSGAGLYDSKTQHPDEGHIAKSVKQVYASLWNLRAFEERDFYRINQFTTSMGVMCHPNYSLEKVNGVGVSTDPLYSTKDTYYLNSQLGDDLITNPDGTSVPEEILIDGILGSQGDFTVIRRSNLIPSGELLMSEPYLFQMREFLAVIHEEFAKVYKAEDNPTFAMDIEYKITATDQLIIKQARPWVSYIPKENPVIDNSDKPIIMLFPNPASESIAVQCNYCNLARIRITDILGRTVENVDTDVSVHLNTEMQIGHLSSGLYILSGFDSDNKLYHSVKFIKR